MNRKLVVFTPTGARSTDTEHNIAKWGHLRNLFAAKQLCDVQIQEQHGLGLDRMRNLACANALRDPQAPDLLFIDRDIAFRAPDVEAMWRSPFDVVGGAYPMKEIRWEEVHALAQAGLPPSLLPFVASSVVCAMSEDAVAGKRSTHVPNLGEFIEVDEIGTGFLLIRNHVLRRYVERYREQIEYTTDPAFDDGHTKMWLIFSCRRDPADDSPSGGYLSEDYYFCRMWRAMGGKVHCYAEAQLRHAGSFVFESRLAVSLALKRAALEAVDVGEAQKRKLALPGTKDFRDTLAKRT